MASNNSNKPPAWRFSEAKQELKRLLEEDEDWFWHNVDPHELYRMSPLFQQYDEDRFVDNLKNLKQAIAKEKAATDFDQKAYENDLKLFPRDVIGCRGYKRWDGSDAKKLLKKDVKDNVHKIPSKIPPREFQLTRPEYKEFPKDIFRKHIYQEEYAQKGRSYWMWKKEQKKAQKKAQKKKKTQNK
jgi:hypothetical protein